MVNDQASLEALLQAIGDWREQQLKRLAVRKDFSPFLTEEIKQILENFQRERARVVGNQR